MPTNWHIANENLRMMSYQAEVKVNSQGEVTSLLAAWSQGNQNALNELPEVFRTPIILYYFEDFTYRDIAEQMDLPLGTVMSRLARAKTFLRSRLLASAQRTEDRGQRSEVGGRRSGDAGHRIGCLLISDL